MTLGNFMNQFFDETWFRITDLKGQVHDIWCADYIGGYEPVMEELDPMLRKTIEDDVSVEVHTDPEDSRRRVPMVCVQLYKPQPRLRRCNADLD